MSSNHDGEEFQHGNGRRDEPQRPTFREPGVLPDRAKTSSSGSVGCDEHLRQRGYGGHSEKTHPVPGTKELCPPGQIAPEFDIEADRVMWRPKGAEEIDHAAKEGPTGRNDLTHMMECANQGLELGARAPSFRLPVKEQRLCSGKHGLRAEAGPFERPNRARCPKNQPRGGTITLGGFKGSPNL